jgi:hypothetical protein
MTEEKKDRTELEREHTAKPEANPGDRSHDPEPHHTLNNPVSDNPDETSPDDPYAPDGSDEAPEVPDDSPKPPEEGG